MTILGSSQSPNPFLPLRKRSQSNQSSHDSLIRTVAFEYHKNGKYVRADHIGWIHGKPEKVGFHVPDIAVYDSSGILNIEVETIDSCLEQHSLSQLRVFSIAGITHVLLVVPPVTRLNEKYIENQKNRWISVISKYDNLYYKIYQQ